jgi:protoporphyrinogen oxidase
MTKDISILGGGPAGLAAAYYAKNYSIDFKLFESAGKVGGNCSTYNYDDFLFDSGAHRLHDKDPETTRIFKGLLGDELNLIHVPSQIYRDSKFIDFPLSPLNLLKHMGLLQFSKAGFNTITNRIFGESEARHFEQLATNKYGRLVAELFLLRYTEKLWGLSADKLSIDVAGSRLKGLDLKTFILESILSKKEKTSHLDGSFYYPKFGIGSLFEKLAEHCGNDKIHCNHSVNCINHFDKKVKSIIADGNEFSVDEVICSLPLGTTIRLLNPSPPSEILEQVNRIKFRNILLIGIFLDKASVNPNGSIYFPSDEYIFTRVYEPRNRSAAMSPKGKTSLMVEIPCQGSDEVWNNPGPVIENVINQMIGIGFFSESEVIDINHYKIQNAYPILQSDYHEIIRPINNYLAQFKNLRLTGRNGLFSYSHIHDHMINGRNIILDIKNGG